MYLTINCLQMIACLIVFLLCASKERIRRMQSVFNRERNKHKRGYESWREYGPGQYHQHFQRDDWYWKTETSSRDRRTNYGQTPQNNLSYSLSHHYTVLGLDRYWTIWIHISWCCFINFTGVSFYITLYLTSNF